MTPRKLTALAKIHIEVEGGTEEDKAKKEPKVSFIDQVM